MPCGAIDPAECLLDNLIMLAVGLKATHIASMSTGFC